MVDTAAAIEEYAQLAIRRHRGELPLEERPKMDALEAVLRDSIEGARPAPKRIENPAAVRTHNTLPPAKVVVTVNPADGRSVPAEPVRVNASDEAKLKQIQAIPTSGYTPPVNPCFLEDYYSPDISLLHQSLEARPTSIRPAETGSEVHLRRAEAELLGLGAEFVSDTESIPPLRMSMPTTQDILPSTGVVTVIVHLMSGGIARGALVSFNTGEGGSVCVQPPSGPDELIPIDGVLAVFFATPRGEPKSEPQGQQLTVTLMNDRELAGQSPDYSPDAAEMYLVPTGVRGHVDRIWIPAWAVKSIRVENS